MRARGLHAYHIQILRALVVPRVAPAASIELRALRANIEGDLDKLLIGERVSFLPSFSLSLSLALSHSLYLTPPPPSPLTPLQASLPW
jgi:hypothetical protein